MRKGFTLIELLTVVLIIAVLTAVALPQYRRVVRRSEVMEAVSMLRSLYDSSERLAGECGSRSYAKMVDPVMMGISDRCSGWMKQLDLFSGGLDSAGDEYGYKFDCKAEEFTLRCPAGHNPRWGYVLNHHLGKPFDVTSNTKYITAIRMEGKNKGTQILFDRDTQEIFCVPELSDTVGRACDAYGLDIKAGATSLRKDQVNMALSNSQSGANPGFSSR